MRRIIKLSSISCESPLLCQIVCADEIDKSSVQAGPRKHGWQTWRQNMIHEKFPLNIFSHGCRCKEGLQNNDIERKQISFKKSRCFSREMKRSLIPPHSSDKLLCNRNLIWKLIFFPFFHHKSRVPHQPDLISRILLCFHCGVSVVSLLWVGG